jgi:hypothetical protein
MPITRPGTSYPHQKDHDDGPDHTDYLLDSRTVNISSRISATSLNKAINTLSKLKAGLNIKK